MRKTLVITVFMLAMLAWATAQQRGSMPGQSGGQATSPGSQAPDASRPPTGSSDQGSAQTGSQPGTQDPGGFPPITEGCLAGSNPNFTITDKAGTTYKLNLPPNADASVLTPHVGESVLVMGDVKNASGPEKASIDVSRMGRGTGTCPPSGSSGGSK